VEPCNTAPQLTILMGGEGVHGSGVGHPVDVKFMLYDMSSNISEK